MLEVMRDILQSHYLCSNIARLSCAQHHTHTAVAYFAFINMQTLCLNPFCTATVSFMHGPSYWYTYVQICRLDYQVQKFGFINGVDNVS